MKNLMEIVILVSFVFSYVSAQTHLITENLEGSEEELACCDGDDILSCEHINVNATALGDQDLELTPLGESVQFKGMVGDSDHSYHYSNENTDVVLTYNSLSGGLYGHVSVESSGASFVIEFCGNGTHVLKSLDVENMGEDLEADDFVEEEDSRKKRETSDEASSDTTTIVTYSVKIYYTPQFKASTADIDGFLDQVIQETNQGYINSQAPIRVKLACSEEATLNDNSSPSTMLSQFRGMKGSTTALRGTADAAALLVNNFGACGIGYVNTVRSGNTVSVTKKSCALGYYSFGHEIGHNIGLMHNRETGHSNSYYSDGYGHLIAAGSGSSGKRTILAYYASGHRTRVNYYSNPSVNYPSTGTPTGVSGVSNNVRILTINRQALAALGDESSCGSGPATPRPIKCTVSSEYRYFRHRYIGRLSASNCKLRCTSDSSCMGWVKHNRYSWCYLLQKRTLTSRSYSSGPDLSVKACNLDKAGCSVSNTILYATYKGYRSSSSANDCHAACSADSQCAQWRWYDSRDRCYMYRANYRSYSGWTSGPRYC